MRRVLFAVSGTIAGLVMLLSFKTQVTPASVPAAASTPDTTGGSAADPTVGAGTSAPAPAPSGGAASTGTKTVTGAAADTRWGPVQVQITVTDGAVTAVTAVEYPQNNGRDIEINSYAVPQLNQEATAAKSATIDTVSGATVTSDGYIQSLQSALDKAGL
jgi:uncharacterized protein with FMN-binding domain